jgi:hypothetical protein
MKQFMKDVERKLGNASIHLGERSCGRSAFLFIHEVPIPEKMKRELGRKNRK